MRVWTTVGAIMVVLTLTTLGVPPLGSAEQSQNIEQIIVGANTPADHKAAADFYRAESTKLRREADQHATLAETLTGEAGGQNPAASHHYEQAEHCRKFAASLSEAAQEAHALAQIHDRLAQSSAAGQK